MSVSPDEFRIGMRQLAAAVNVVTTVDDGRRAGMTATAVVSLTADPPQIGIAVNRGSSTYKALAAAGVFAVNVLPHDHAGLAGVFAGAGALKGEDRFAEGAWDGLATGAPTLVDAAACFDCRVVREVELSSHSLFIGLVEAIRIRATATPLLFMDGSWASLVRAGDTEFEAYGQVVEKVAAAMDAAAASGACAGDQLALFAHTFAGLNTASADVLRDFFSRETFVPAQRLDGINRRKREVEEKLRLLLARGAETGEFEIPDPAVTADALIGMLNSVYRWPRRERHDGPESIAHAFQRLVAAMVRPASADATAIRRPDTAAG